VQINLRLTKLIFVGGPPLARIPIARMHLQENGRIENGRKEIARTKFNEKENTRIYMGKCPKLNVIHKQ
jgi:hypothetical protein